MPLASGLPSIIKSIQYGTINVAASTSGSFTVTAVNVAKSVLIPLNGRTMIARYALTNSTTVSVSTNTTTSDDFGFCLVEYF